MKTLFCIDASGSVGGQTLYHNVTANIFNKFYKKEDIIYLWGSHTKKMSEDEFREWNKNKNSGLGGTSSELIADIINGEKNSCIEHLIIITDGQVGTSNIDESDRKMKEYNIHFTYVSTYIIGSGGNRTVGAPYCRGNPNVTYYYKNEANPEKLASLNQEELDLYENMTQQINNYKDLKEKYNMLNNVIEAQMYGKEKDDLLIKNLNAIKSKIEVNALSEDEKDFNEKFDILYKMANGGLRNESNMGFAAKKIK